MTAGQRILVVEDDPEIAYLLHVVLSEEGREVILASSGEEAGSRLAEGRVDLVILDLILPDADGRSLLSGLRDSPETAAVPVIVLTARVGPDTRQDCYRLGADAFLEKPFDPDKLAGDVAARLARAAQAERAAHRDARTGLLNRAGLQARLSEKGLPYTLAVLEIDSFAERSERWGWDETERVSLAVARALEGRVTEHVELARVGGDDFALVAYGEDAEALAGIAAEALEGVRGLELELSDDAGALTASVAVVVGERGTSLEDALDAARRKLFRGREQQGDVVLVEEPSSPDRPARVLVAEDDEISATILIHRLSKEGIDVTRFRDGQDAYEAALADVPDLLILDVKMPGMDGFEVLGRLRKNARFARTPIVMLTSLGQEADVVRGFGLGADDYILKPFSPTELTARVRRLLTRGRSASAL